MAEETTTAHPTGEMLTVTAWASDAAGCGNYRVGMPMWALGQLGHRASAVLDLVSAPGDDLDILVGQRVVDEQRSAVWRQLACLPGRNYAMIFELDDDLWHLDPASPWASYYSQPAIRRLLTDNVAMADAVTVTTEPLADIVSAFNTNVFVLPNCIDSSLLEYGHRQPDGEPVTIGWAGGDGHDVDFRQVAPYLIPFFRRNPAIATAFVGASHGTQIGRPQSRVTRGNSNVNEYVKSFAFDVGLAPLALNRFNTSKSDLKVLEYAAVGIPAVASDHGPYRDSIEHGVTGMLAHALADWPRHLRSLARDRDLRAELAANARTWATTRTIQANAWRWQDVYRKVRS
jgi:glycosyltransferase involved in cell wall biosynthesis